MISLGTDEKTVYVLKKHWLYFILIPLVAIVCSFGLLFPFFFIGWRGTNSTKSL